MAKEIERKFLLKNESWRKDVTESFIIKQGFLNTNPERTVRIRLKGNQAFLTVKSKTKGITRNEYEYEIPFEDGVALLLLCEKNSIEKTRYIIQYESFTWEVDVFEGVNKGLEIAEIELRSENQNFVKPTWLSKEVSNDARYYNSSLAKTPFCEW